MFVYNKYIKYTVVFRLNVSLCQLIPIYYSSCTQNFREKTAFLRKDTNPSVKVFV